MKKKILLIIILCLPFVITCGCMFNTKTVTSESSQSGINTGSSTGTYDVYPYDIEADQKKFDASDIDIVVGDKLYMTQINDWFMNFEDYEGKSVEIEGYYLLIDGYTFVGRNGPTCPYCTGGYVDFEFKTNEDVSGWTSGKTWIKVIGILRQGTMYVTGSDPQAFYYIETMAIEKMDAAGLGTITN